MPSNGSDGEEEPKIRTERVSKHYEDRGARRGGGGGRFPDRRPPGSDQPDEDPNERREDRD